MLKRAIISLLVAVPGGFLLLFPLGGLFDTMGWSVFHTWGLVHGSFLIAWPMLSLFVFAVVLRIDLIWNRIKAVLGKS